MIFRLLKVTLVLLFGAVLGLLLGFAYASHLFGKELVFTQMAHLIAGDAVMDVPAPADTAGGYQAGTAALIPRMGACIGFGIAASVMLASIMYRIFYSFISSKTKSGSSSQVQTIDAESGEPKPDL